MSYLVAFRWRRGEKWGKPVKAGDLGELATALSRGLDGQGNEYAIVKNIIKGVK